MTEDQRKKVMALIHGVVFWQNADEEEHDEACDRLHYSVDDMDQETITELVRVVNGCVNLRSV